MAYKVAFVLVLLTTILLQNKCVAVRSTTDSSDTKQLQCDVGTIYKSSLPAGGSGVEHLTVLGVGLKAEECLSKCCSLGPGGCQYLWVMENMCTAVSCETAKMSSCQPKMVASSSLLKSVYVLMEHPQQKSDGLEEALDWVDKITDNNKSREKDGDSPPIAATPTDEIEITLPNNEVYIFGNSSKDDKGISAYSWKLLTEHFVQPILENSDQAILHVSNLIPGTYQFSLTVTDTTGQSGRTTVLIRVNKGPTDSVTTETPAPTQTGLPNTTDPSESVTTLPEEAPNSGSGDGNDTVIVEDHRDIEGFYTRRRNVLKIVIPVLLSVAVLLVVTAAITTACACCCERNKHRMKRYYRYRKLPETIEKT